MIKGVGTDIIEIVRIEKACKKSRFVERIYTDTECRQTRGNASKLAGNFAVKEAVSKVFGTGFGAVSPKEIEVLRYESGKPYVVLHGQAEKTARKCEINTIHVSISNTDNLVIAFAIGEGADV